MGRDPISPQPPGPVVPYVTPGRPITPAHKPGAGAVNLHKMVGHEMTITPEGPRIVIIGHIEDVEGDPWQMLINAYANPLVPKLWSFHPVMTDLPLTNIQVRPLSDSSPNTAHVTLTYAYTQGGTGFINPPSDTVLPQIEVSSTVQPMTTQFFLEPSSVPGVDTQRQILVYEANEAGTANEPQVGEVEYQQPLLVVRYRRREPAVDSRGRRPGDKAKRFVGTVNKSITFFDAAHYWMCTRVDAASDDAGASYNMTYEFQRHPDTWDPVVVYRDRDTGEPVEITSTGDDANESYAMWQGRIYYEQEFRDLDLGVFD